MYIETSSPRKRGDNAKLQLSVSRNEQQSCLKFYYHMYGGTVGTLTVFSGNVAVFNETGYKGWKWLEAERTISSNEMVSFSWVTFSWHRSVACYTL